ncbi:MAG: dUTP diphosphatase [Dehalococcoidia bacterium]
MPAKRAVLKVKRLRPGAQLPQRASAGAAGLDLYACLESPIDVGHDPFPIPTGIAIELPRGYEAQIRPRSGLTAQGVAISFGTVDSDYRGEVLVTMYVFGSRSSFNVRHGDRIAQLVIGRVADLAVQEAQELSPTERGAGGHGSTGL